MKASINTIFIILLFGIINLCFSQWQADLRLTNNPAASYTNYNNAWCIAANGDIVHVVWHDNRDGNLEIYYKRSVDGGSSWGADTRLTNAINNSSHPSILVSGQVVHVVWDDSRDGNIEIYYKHSTDGGVSWGTDARLTNAIHNSWLPSVSASDSVVHAVWYDQRDGNWEIYYKRDPTGNPLGIININSEIPNEYKLFQNYPNPFNPVTKIDFSVPKSGYINITVFDITGKEAAVLVNENITAGHYTVDFDGVHLASGVYFYRITTKDFTQTKKMLLMK